MTSKIPTLSSVVKEIDIDELTHDEKVLIHKLNTLCKKREISIKFEFGKKIIVNSKKKFKVYNLTE